MSDYDLDPALAAYVAASAKFACAVEDIAARRDAFAKACAYFTPLKPDGLAIEDSEVNGVAIRIYSPQFPAPSEGWPAILYFHGGGWNMGSHTTHDWFAFALLRRVEMVVIAVDYRLAPEHPFPAPLEDGFEVWRALHQGAFPIINSCKLAVGGDSAGGTLAAGLCVALRELGMRQPKLQVLVYPVLTARRDLESMHKHANAPMLTTAGLEASLQGFAPVAQDKRNPRAFALEIEDAAELAPAFIAVAEFDPLFDHGIAYAKRLREAGVAVDVHVGIGLVHASLRAAGVTRVEALYDQIANRLERMADA